MSKFILGRELKTPVNQYYSKATAMSESELSIEHFRNILGNANSYLNELCEKWSKVIEDQSISSDMDDELQGSIRTAIGQAKLLMAQRFKQFSQLIDDCQYQKGEHKTRLADLSGFWDMITFQIDDVKKKFQKIEKTYSA